MSDPTTMTRPDLEVDGTPPLDTTGDDLATLLRRREHARPTKLTWVLLTLLVVAVGFVGGAVAQQRFGSSASAPGLSGPPAGMTLPTGFPSGAGFPGAAAGAGGADSSGSVTTGTVKLVDGSHVYLTDASGNTVTILVPADATLTSEQAITLADLSVGDTVTVSGQAGTDGSVTATSLSQGATASTGSTTTQPAPSPTPTASPTR